MLLLLHLPTLFLSFSVSLYRKVSYRGCKTELTVNILFVIKQRKNSCKIRIRTEQTLRYYGIQKGSWDNSKSVKKVSWENTVGLYRKITGKA